MQLLGSTDCSYDHFELRTLSSYIIFSGCAIIYKSTTSTCMNSYILEYTSYYWNNNPILLCIPSDDGLADCLCRTTVASFEIKAAFVAVIVKRRSLNVGSNIEYDASYV
jgi:hypothetical protein